MTKSYERLVQEEVVIELMQAFIKASDEIFTRHGTDPNNSAIVATAIICYLEIVDKVDPTVSGIVSRMLVEMKDGRT